MSVQPSLIPTLASADAGATAGGTLGARMTAWAQPAVAVWRQRTPRERAVLVAGGGALALLVVWQVGLKPAWDTWREAPVQRAALEAQWQTMQAAAEDTARWRGVPPLPAAQAEAALKAATERLGSGARLSVQRDRAVLTLDGVPPGALADWLQEVRSGARARATEVQLSRQARGFTGSVTLTLPAAP